MRPKLLMVVLLAVTLLPTWGEEIVPVVFDVHPPGTSIWLELEGSEPILLGQSGSEPVPVDLALFQGQETYRLRYELDGFLPAFELVTQNERRKDLDVLARVGRWPRGSPRTLTSSSAEVVFHTVPTRAAVYLPGDDRPLGLSNEIIKMDRAQFLDRATGTAISFDVDLKLDGHLPATIEVGEEVWDRHRWPPAGAVRLQATSYQVALRYWIRDNPVAFAASAGSLLLLAGACGVQLGLRRTRGRQEAQRRARIRDLIKQAEATDDPFLGERLGRYRLVENLDDEGAYRAVPDSTLDDQEQVFLRVLLIAEEDSSNVRRALENRVDQLRTRVDHPTVIRLVDWGEEEEYLCLVTEWVDGARLELPAEAMPPEEVLPLVRPLFEALAHSHRHGIPHRRLSPDKVWVTRRGKIKLGGFEPAEPEAREEPYRAPEQEAGALATSRSDQYALGCIVYRLLTGTLPTRPPRPLQAVSRLPKRLCDAVMRMLEEKPANRFRNLSEALGQLDAEPVEGES